MCLAGVPGVKFSFRFLGVLLNPLASMSQSHALGASRSCLHPKSTHLLSSLHFRLGACATCCCAVHNSPLAKACDSLWGWIQWVACEPTKSGESERRDWTEIVRDGGQSKTSGEGNCSEVRKSMRAARRRPFPFLTSFLAPQRRCVPRMRRIVEIEARAAVIAAKAKGDVWQK